MFLRKVIAHRGFSNNYPENTMLAFEKAIEIGAKCIETDVTILKDGTLVLFHDYETKEHSNHDGIINDLDYNDIKRIDAGSWKDAKFSSASSSGRGAPPAGRTSSQNGSIKSGIRPSGR